MAGYLTFSTVYNITHQNAAFSDITVQKKRSKNKFKSCDFDIHRNLNGKTCRIYDATVCVLFQSCTFIFFFFAYISYPFLCILYFDLLFIAM
jgi:hypothetical protein